MTDHGFYRAYGPQRNLQPKTLELISHVNAIIKNYAEDGIYNLSVRQIYYRYLSTVDPSKNTKQFYDQIGDVISKGRMAGLISWEAIEDRNRNLSGLNTFEDVGELLSAAGRGYRIDKWWNQPWRPEVWVEKAALEGVVGSICNELQVNFLCLRGYNSQSEQWKAGRRFARYYSKGQRPIVFHLGDHDPSGIDMTRDNAERLEMFCGTPVMVQRLGLNRDQVYAFDLPPNYAKEKDVRTEGYVEQFGTDECWELDALDPKVIRDIIKSAVERIRDPKLWDVALLREAQDVDELRTIIKEAGGTVDEEPEND